MEKRIIKLKSVHNLRTLGGLAGKGGKIIRDGILLRSAALDALTPKDEKHLRERYGLKTVIDLRTNAEVGKKPDAVSASLTYLHMPVCADAMPGVSREAEPGRDATADMLPNLADMYRAVIRDPEAMENYSRILKTILRHRDGAVLWHCTAGKDRCGLTAVFLESILGVLPADIRADYLLTNRDSIGKARMYYWVIRLLKRDRALADKVYRAYLADSRYLDAALAEIDAMGGMDGYLHEHLHLTDDEMDAFRAYALQ